MQQNYASLILLSLSLTLLLSGTWCSPIHRRSPMEAESQQPARCRLSRPRSTYQCIEDSKVRRYFLHNVKGCKKFGLCPEDAAVHDNKTEFGEGNFFLNFQDCQMECMQHVTCPDLTVGDNLVLVSDNGLQGWGKKVVYECSSGYSLSDNSAHSSRTCERNGTWSGTTPICLKQCQAPPPVGHAYIAPSKLLHSQGSTVHYTCQVGYQLQDSAQRTCGPNGEWSNPDPSCVCQVASATDACPSCPEPSPIEHGRVSAPNRSLFSEIEYMCDDDYILVGNKNRVCEENGEWSLKEPICWKLSIVKQSDSHDEDVTNRAVTVSLNAMGIKFMAISSTPNPFPDMIPEWIFKDGEALPHGVNQKGLNLVFDSILKSQEQKGTYTITFGNYSAFFELQTQEATPEIILPSVLFPPMAPQLPKATGDMVTFHCAINGCPVPDVVWYHNDEEVSVLDERISIVVTKSHGLVLGLLTISNLNEDDNGSYRCQGTSSVGNISTISAELQVQSSLRKRSVEEEDPINFPCPTDKDVILVGHVGREHRQIRSSSSGMADYRVQVSRFLQGVENLSSKRIRVVMLDSVPSSSSLSENVDYVFRGRIINQTMFVFRQNVQRHSETLEKLINSC